MEEFYILWKERDRVRTVLTLLKQMERTKRDVHGKPLGSLEDVQQDIKDMIVVERYLEERLLKLYPPDMHRIDAVGQLISRWKDERS